jgi:methionine-rich copper-binding protein CopC
MMGEEDRKIPPPRGREGEIEREAMPERRAMLKTTSMTVVALFAACLIATSAYAHPTLKSASPPVDGTAAAAPTEIKLSFSEAVISKFSSVELQDQSGMKVATGKVATDAKDEKQLVVSLKAPLKAGTYTVKWVVVTADTHRVNGRYSFKVAL